jgi:LacI family transcriptional regulator
VRHATIHDVAKTSGFSKSTVSRVLRGSDEISEEARQSVLKAVHDLGYQPNMLAGGLRTRRTYSIALIIPDISNPFFPDIARGAQMVADKRGYTVFFANTDWLERREHDFLALARRNRVEGILMNPVGAPSPELKHVGCPVVILGDRDGYGEFDIIGSDTAAGLLLAIDHLVGHGHRRIALICGPQGNPAAAKRLAAFRTALAQHTLSVPDEMVGYAEFSQAGGREAAHTLVHQASRPTAIVCGNDLLALGALAGIRDVGLRVPEDVAVVGIDNIDASAVTYPPLTTVAKPKFRIGEEAATLLLDRIEGKEAGPPHRRLLSTELIVRGSSVSQEAPGAAAAGRSR